MAARARRVTRRRLVGCCEDQPRQCKTNTLVMSFTAVTSPAPTNPRIVSRSGASRAGSQAVFLGIDAIDQLHGRNIPNPPARFDAQEARAGR